MSTGKCVAFLCGFTSKPMILHGFLCFYNIVVCILQVYVYMVFSSGKPLFYMFFAFQILSVAHIRKEYVLCFLINYVFLNFQVKTQTFNIFDHKFGFYIEFHVYVQILRSIGLRGGQNISKTCYIRIQYVFLGLLGFTQFLQAFLQVCIGLWRVLYGL